MKKSVVQMILRSGEVTAMKCYLFPFFLSPWLSFASELGAVRGEHWQLSSPDGRIHVDISRSDDKLPRYSVSRDGVAVIAPSTLGLSTDLEHFGAKGFAIASDKKRSVDDIWHMPWGKTSDVPERYNELTLVFTEIEGARQMVVIFRAYDDGVAFRYRIPHVAGVEAVGVFEEHSEFAFLSNYACWGADIEGYHTSQETEYYPLRAAHIRKHHTYLLPFVGQTGHGETTFALAEADVEHYPTGFYGRSVKSDLGMEIRLPQRMRRDEAGGARPYIAKIPQGADGIRTPWRVLMLADSPRGLAESSLIWLLGAPSRVADTSWIKGGKAAWDWWSDSQAPVANPGMNTETFLAYIDLADELGLEYLLIDWNWYHGCSSRPLPGSDVIRPIDEMDMPKIISYAKERNIGVFVWVQWQQLDWQFDEALASYEQWGIKGIKVDFMDRSDQEMVDFYHKLLTKAAEHKLLVDLHGAYAPNGLARTYPHYLTQEGVLAAEYNKFSKRVTASHNVTLPYTRMILGPMDYTPGAFSHVSPEEFYPRNKNPLTMTTRGHGVAMYVVYDSPFVMVADSPQMYKNVDGSWKDGVDFIRDVPVSWDETRVLQGAIGEYIVTARRKGDTWYIGAMTNEEGRTIRLPLDFLPEARYAATLWQDGKTMSELERSTKALRRSESLTLRLASSGGGVAVLKPVK